MDASLETELITASTVLTADLVALRVYHVGDGNPLLGHMPADLPCLWRRHDTVASYFAMLTYRH